MVVVSNTSKDFCELYDYSYYHCSEEKTEVKQITLARAVCVLVLLVRILSAGPCANPIVLSTYPGGTAISPGLFPADCSFDNQLAFSAFAISNGVPASPNVLVTWTGGRTLLINPQLSFPGQDTLLFERVGADGGGPIYQADMHSIAGSFNFSVSQQVCESLSQSGGCVGGLGNLMIDMSHTDAIALFAPHDMVYVGKDIMTNPMGSQASLTGFSQIFGVPEPVSLAIVGSGLLRLGLVRRRR